MIARRLALAGAVIAVVSWALKAVAIGIAGGLDRSPFESPLFGLGLVGLVVAFFGIGLAAASKRSRLGKVVGGVLGLLIGIAFFLAVENAVGAVVPESAGWVQEEAGLWVIAIVTLIAALAVTGRRNTPAPG